MSCSQPITAGYPCTAETPPVSRGPRNQEGGLQAAHPMLVSAVDGRVKPGHDGRDGGNSLRHQGEYARVSLATLPNVMNA